MIETKDITKMVRNITRRDKGLPDPQIMHPMREWVTGLSIVLIGVLSGSVLAFQLYQYYSAQLQIEIIAPEARVPYDASVVESALKLYREQKSTYDSIVGFDKTTVIDETGKLNVSSTTATSSSQINATQANATSTPTSTPKITSSSTKATTTSAIKTNATTTSKVEATIDQNMNQPAL